MEGLQDCARKLAQARAERREVEHGVDLGQMRKVLSRLSTLLRASRKGVDPEELKEASKVLRQVFAEMPRPAPSSPDAGFDLLHHALASESLTSRDELVLELHKRLKLLQKKLLRAPARYPRAADAIAETLADVLEKRPGREVRLFYAYAKHGLASLERLARKRAETSDPTLGLEADWADELPDPRQPSDTSDESQLLERWVSAWEDLKSNLQPLGAAYYFEPFPRRLEAAHAALAQQLTNSHNTTLWLGRLRDQLAKNEQQDGAFVSQHFNAGGAVTQETTDRVLTALQYVRGLGQRTAPGAGSQSPSPAAADPLAPWLGPRVLGGPGMAPEGVRLEPLGALRVGAAALAYALVADGGTAKQTKHLWRDGQTTERKMSNKDIFWEMMDRIGSRKDGAGRGASDKLPGELSLALRTNPVTIRQQIARLRAAMVNTPGAQAWFADAGISVQDANERSYASTLPGTQPVVAWLGRASGYLAINNTVVVKHVWLLMALTDDGPLEAVAAWPDSPDQPSDEVRKKLPGLDRTLAVDARLSALLTVVQTPPPLTPLFDLLHKALGPLPDRGDKDQVSAAVAQALTLLPDTRAAETALRYSGPNRLLKEVLRPDGELTGAVCGLASLPTSTLGALAAAVRRPPLPRLSLRRAEIEPKRLAAACLAEERARLRREQGGDES